MYVGVVISEVDQVDSAVDTERIGIPANGQSKSKSDIRKIIMTEWLSTL